MHLINSWSFLVKTDFLDILLHDLIILHWSCRFALRRRTTLSNPVRDTVPLHLTGTSFPCFQNKQDKNFKYITIHSSSIISSSGKRDLSKDGSMLCLTPVSPMKSAVSGFRTGLRYLLYTFLFYFRQIFIRTSCIVQLKSNFKCNFC